MNFLAHLALSGDNAEVIMGNFAGDYVKGRLDLSKDANWTKDYLTGLKLHRFIDHFTDTDATVLTLMKRLRVRYSRSAPIAVDLFFDHFLALDFEKYHPDSLGHFVEFIHHIIEDHPFLVPPKMTLFAKAMIENNWLLHYRELPAIQKTITNMGVRHPFLKNLEGATADLSENFDAYQSYFSEFYPRLQLACAGFLLRCSESDRVGGPSERITT